jgi:hypothetical protein
MSQKIFLSEISSQFLNWYLHCTLDLKPQVFYMKNKIYSLILVLVIAQVLLFYKTMQLGNGDYTGFIIMTVITIVLTALFVAGYRWAKWVEMGFLGMVTIMSVIGGVQHNDLLFYAIALLQALALYVVYQAKISGRASS